MFDHYRVLTPKPSQCHISNSIYPNLGKIDGRVETRLNKDRPEKKNGILLPKLFWPTLRKNCSSDWEKLYKFEAEGWEFVKFLGSLEHFIQTVKGPKIFGNRMSFWIVPGGFSYLTN